MALTQQQENTPLRILVVGGGVAGPSLGIAIKKLRGDDAHVTIIETHPYSEECIGSYFTLQENGVDALKTLGVLDEVRAMGFPTTTSMMMRGDGGVLGRIPFGDSVTVKRTQVNQLLMRKAAAAGCTVRYGTTLVDVLQEEASSPETSKDVGDGSWCRTTRQVKAIAVFADHTRESFDLVVGADGVHSSIRKRIDPVSAPDGRFVGLVNFAGVAPPLPKGLQPLVPHGWHFCFAQRSFILYHLRPDGHIVWGVNEPRAARVSKDERAAMSDEWVRRYLLELFAPDKNPVISFIVSHGTIELVGDNQCDLPNVPVWHNANGNMTLIGDAVHAPSPTSGQGGSMALEDGIVLAKALAESDTVKEALALYEGFRRQRVEKIVAMGAAMSQNKMPGPFARRVRDVLMPIAIRCMDFEENLKWVASYRIVWDLPLKAQPPQPREAHPLRVFRKGIIGLGSIVVASAAIWVALKRSLTTGHA